MASLKNQRGAYTEEGDGSPRTPEPSNRAAEVALLDRIALSASDLAALLGISRAHVWKLLSLGKLPAPVRLGRAVRWNRREIQAWLTAGAPSAEQWDAVKESGKVS